jgi:hypothetical protein
VISDVVVRRAGRKGQGVFALRGFSKGEFVFRKVQGLAIANRNVCKLSKEQQQHICAIDLDSSAVWRPPACYLNHSCEPNAMCRGDRILAWKTIKEGDEITIDYRLLVSDGGLWRCFCGTRSCAGEVVGGFFGLSSQRQALYLQYAARYVQLEYRRRKAAS